MQFTRSFIVLLCSLALSQPCLADLSEDLRDLSEDTHDLSMDDLKDLSEDTHDLSMDDLSEDLSEDTHHDLSEDTHHDLSEDTHQKKKEGDTHLILHKIRFATFNIAMGLEERGELHNRLRSGNDEALKKVAAIIQKVRPDVLLLNEFDWFELDSTLLFISNYLDEPQFGNKPISYAHAMNGAVNTGMDSGMDLNNNDVLGDPEDAWGFGFFPGQYGMAVFSRFPLKLEHAFRLFKWSDMPDGLRPTHADGSSWYADETYNKLRLSSKNHWDIALEIGEKTIHFLVSHPTPPVFDGPEDRYGLRNHDEIRLWADYIDPGRSGYIQDDKGVTGGLINDALFIIAGDLNADPIDGASFNNAIKQLLEHPLVNVSCVPGSEGATEAARLQGGKNSDHKGDPAFDTGDFNDQYIGNMRIDYVLPSATIKVVDCGVFWPLSDQIEHQWIAVSDHRLVWVDIKWE